MDYLKTAMKSDIIQRVEWKRWDRRGVRLDGTTLVFLESL